MYAFSNIVEIVGGQWQGCQEDRQIQDLLTDSRQLVTPGQTLFFALTSNRNDGHKYIEELYRNGVRCFVVSVIPDGEFPGASFLVV